MFIVFSFVVNAMNFKEFEHYMIENLFRIGFKNTAKYMSAFDDFLVNSMGKSREEFDDKIYPLLASRNRLCRQKLLQCAQNAICKRICFCKTCKSTKEERLFAKAR